MNFEDITYEIIRLNRIIRNPQHKCFQIAVAQLRGIRQMYNATDIDLKRLGKDLAKMGIEWQYTKGWEKMRLSLAKTTERKKRS